MAIQIVYIAPMRALTSEISSKFQSRLQNLKLKVRKVTGEDNPTQKEIEEAQVGVLLLLLLSAFLALKVTCSLTGAGIDPGEMGCANKTPRCGELHFTHATVDNRRGAHAADE